MRLIFSQIIGWILNPAVRTESLFTLIALAALAVAGIAIYATIVIVKTLGGRR